MQPPSADRKVDDTLGKSMHLLERALGARTAGREYHWSAAVADALGQVRDAMVLNNRRGNPDRSSVDITCPTIARQLNNLGRDLSSCLERAEALHRAVSDVSLVFGPRSKSSAAAREQPIPDFGDLRRRTSELLGNLDRIREREADLILESVNTDIGEGD